ncbi:MAG: LysR family transcriptional regulator [Alicyclobacillaceae bacterium]|nr:LysR family transcriptional regulator [Alicyclobacillaceae bacterium]
MTFETTLHRLRVFKAVVELGSFKLASLHLGITQPAVSAHIQALEQEIRRPLFIRCAGKAPTLTETGSLVYAYAQDVLRRTEQLEMLIADLDSHPQRLTISTQKDIANTLLPAYVQNFKSIYRDVELVIRAHIQDQVIDDVRHARVHLGLILSAQHIHGLHTQVLSREPLVFIVGHDHELARRTRVSPADLQKYKFVCGIQTSMYAKMIRTLLAQLGLCDYCVTVQVEDGLTAIEIVKRGEEVAALPLYCVEADLRAGSIRAVDLACDPPYLQLQLIRSEHQPLSRLAQEFAALLKSRTRSVPSPVSK